MAYHTQSTDYDNPSWSNRWEDWANLVLGFCLFISPWILRFAAGTETGMPGGGVPPVGAAGGPIDTSNAAFDAAWDAWVFGAIVFLLALSALRRMQFWQEGITLLVGIWLFIAPWVLGFTPLVAASWDHWIIGALVFLISAWSLSAMRRMTTGLDLAHAGRKPPPRDL